MKIKSMKIKSIIITIFMLIGMLSNFNVYASSEYTDAIRTIGSLLDNSPTGFSEIMDLPDGYVLNLAADILDGKNPEDILKNFVKDFTISKVEEKITIAGTLINVLFGNALFQIDLCDSNDRPLKEQSVYEYFNLPAAKNFKIELTQEELENLDHINIKRHSYVEAVNIINSESWKRSDGKTDVMADVLSLSSQHAGFLAIGFDANNKAIETKCVNAYTLAGTANHLVLTLDSRNVDHVEVKATGNESEIQLLSSADRVENGKVIVTGVVENGTKAADHVGILAIGYDKNNKAVETKAIDSYLLAGDADFFTLELDAADIISRVEVKATGNASEIQLLSSGDRVENDKVIVTGVVENGTKAADHVGILAIGYDENNKAVETKAIDSYLLAGEIDFFTLELDAADIISRVEVKATGNASEIQLLSSGDRVENDKVIVTGVVENGTKAADHVGILAIGYDENDKAVETKAIDSYLLAGEIEFFTLELDAADIISRVEVKPTGAETTIKLLSSVAKVINDKVLVTGVVENGSTKGINTGIVVIGYDKNNTAVETKSFTKYTNKGGILNCEVSLNSGGVIKYVEVMVQGDTSGFVEVLVVEEPDEVLKGDLDGNGEFNSLDFALMRAYLVGKVTTLTENQMKAADVNCDGSVDSLDFAIMRHVIVGKRPGFN